MVGYGPEDNHFVVELTYNYGIKNYKLGNDFLVSLVNSLCMWIENIKKQFGSFSNGVVNIVQGRFNKKSTVVY